MPAATVSKYLRRLGEPSVEVDPSSGLKRITRRYIADITGVEKTNLEADVILPFGSSDREHTDALLVRQGVEWSGESASLTCTRVFQELGNGAELVEIGEPVAEKIENNLWRVTRTLVTFVGSTADEAAKTSYGAAVGSATFVHEDATLLLALWKREVKDGILATYTLAYQEPGIIRVDLNPKYGGRLIEYNISGYQITDDDVDASIFEGGVKPPLIETSTDNYNGMRSVRLRYVAGEGIISVSRSNKTGDSAIVEYVLVSVNKTPSEALEDGYSEEHGGETIDADWLAEVGLNSLDTSSRDNYIIYTARYIKLEGAAGYVGGSAGGTIEGGEISIGDVNVDLETEWSGFNIPADSILTDNYTTAYGGNVDVRQLSFLVDISAETPDFDSLLGAQVTDESGNWTVVDTRIQLYPGYAVGEFKLVRGAGVIAVSQDTRFADIRQGYTGGVVFQVQSINMSPIDAGMFVHSDGVTYDFTEAKVTKVDVKDTEAGPLYTVELFSGSAITGLSTSVRYDGQLTVTTITGLNINPLEVYATQYGAAVDHETEVNVYGTLYKYVFAQGEGEILRKTETRYNQKVTLTTVRSLNTQPDVPDGAFLVSTNFETDRFGELHTFVWATGSGVISTNTELRHSGALEVTTVQSINEPPELPTGAYLMSVRTESGAYGEVYTFRYALGEGEIQRSTESRHNGALTITTVQYLNGTPAIPNGVHRISEKTETSDFGTIYTYKWAEGEGEINRTTETRYEGKLTITTIQWLNTIPSAGVVSGALVSTKVESVEFGTVYTYQYADGSGEISRSERSLYGGQIKIVAVRSLNEEPAFGGEVIERGSEDSPYGTIFTARWAVIVGFELSRSTRTRYPDSGGNPQLTVTKVERLDDNPDIPSNAYVLSTATSEREYGTVYQYEWAVGSGILSTSSSTRVVGQGSDVLKVYTVRGLNVVPTRADLDGEMPADWAGTIRQIGSSEATGDYGTTYEARFSAGLGLVSTVETRPYLGREVVVSKQRWVNQPPPSLPEGDRLISERVEDGDAATFYEVTFARGSAIIADSFRNVYEDRFIINTVQALEIYDASELPGGNRGSLVTTSVSQGSYGAVITFVFARGVAVSPIIGQSDSVVLTDQDETPIITRHTISSLLRPATETEARAVFQDPASNLARRVTLVSQQTQSTEFGPRYEQVWMVAARSGAIISETESTLEFGAARRIVTTLGEIRNRDVPSGYFLVGEQVGTQHNYTIITSTYYKPPNSYSLEFGRSYLLPGLVTANNNSITGFTVVREATTQTLYGTVEVEFTTNPPASTDLSEILNPSAQVVLQFSSASEEHPNFNTDKVLILDKFYANPAELEITSINGIAAIGATSVSGVPQPNNGYYILGTQVEPYFFVSGTQIYKVTTTRVNLIF